MTKRSSEVQRHLAVGNHYAKYALCTRAIECYAMALEDLLGPSTGTPWSIDSGLRDALVGQQSGTVTLDDGSDHPLNQLHAHLAQPRDTPDAASHATLFRVSKQRSIIVYHRLREKKYGTFEIQLPDHESVSTAYLLREEDSQVERLSDEQGNRRSLLAYTISHMANVRLRALEAQNQQGPVFMLTDSNMPMFLECMSQFRHSLYLAPDRAWTWAHWAEAHRIRGCSWIGGIDAIMMSTDRAHAYVEAMVRYQIALELQPESWWANAHYGAAVVNARAFLSFTGGGRECTDPVVSAWFDEQQLDVDTHGGPSQALLAKGAQMLETSQEMLGHYYPWAEVYQGDVHLIRSLIIPGEAGRFLGIVAMLETNAGFYHDPDLPKYIMDPGAPYVNGFFQAALVYYWTRGLNPDNLSTAWAFAVLGVRRTLNFDFNIELYILYACQILVNIAHTMITEEGHKPSNVLAYLAHGTSSRFPVDIRSEILHVEEELVAFIHQITDRVGLPAASSADHQQELEAKDREALRQTLQILANLGDLLDDLGSSHQPLEDLITSIKARLGQGGSKP